MKIPNEFFIGKQFRGYKSGRFEIVGTGSYRGTNKDWLGTDVLFMRTLTGSSNEEYQLFIPVLEALTRHRNTVVSPNNVVDDCKRILEEEGIQSFPNFSVTDTYHMSFVRAIFRK